MRLSVPRRRLLLGLASATAIFLALQAWNRLQGDLYYRQLESLKSKWHESGGAPHDKELNEGFKLGYRASEADSANSVYRFQIAGMHAWRERGLTLWPDQADAETRKIVENLKAALVRRPSWFEAWILLALVKYQADEIDHELTVALEKSIETGPYETSVHHGVSYVVPRIWDSLDTELKRSAAETLRIALTNGHINEFVVEQLVMSGQVDPFRAQIEADERLTRYMEKYMKKRRESL